MNDRRSRPANRRRSRCQAWAGAHLASLCQGGALPIDCLRSPTAAACASRRVGGRVHAGRAGACRAAACTAAGGRPARGVLSFRSGCLQRAGPDVSGWVGSPGGGRAMREEVAIVPTCLLLMTARGGSRGLSPLAPDPEEPRGAVQQEPMPPPPPPRSAPRSTALTRYSSTGASARSTQLRRLLAGRQPVATMGPFAGERRRLRRERVGEGAASDAAGDVGGAARARAPRPAAFSDGGRSGARSLRLHRGFYNTRRLNSALGYGSPLNFERLYDAA